MRALTNEPLFVDPALAGARLASPLRRLLAFFADGIVLMIPTIGVALAAAFISIEASDPRAMQAIVTLLQTRADPAASQRAMRDILPLLVRTEAPGVPAAVKAAIEEGDVNRAVEMMKDYGVSLSLRFDEGRSEVALAPKTVRLELKEVIPPAVRGIALLGVPALYFVIFTRSRRGATLGKRLLGIRVARLDGERLTWLESLERFVGYVHIPGTMFLSLADLWRDPNRRMPHDRVVHTAVFRVRRREAFPPASTVARGERLLTHH